MVTKETEIALRIAEDLTEKLSENQIHTIIGYLQTTDGRLK